MTPISRFSRKGALIVLLAGALLCSGCGLTESLNLSGHPQYMVTDSDEALANWHQARYLQAQGRYELAREHYLLAYAAARGDNVRTALAQELYAVDLQIKTLR